jgi:hypothetical protein
MTKSFIGKWLFEMFLLVMGWVSILIFPNPFGKLLYAAFCWSMAYLWIVKVMADEARKNSIILWGS